MGNENNERMGDGKDNAVTLLDDNPCWGSPTQHQLEDLLGVIDRSKSIIYDSPEYLVLNKPPDLRMDGPYPATVHKLLTYWYPPPSLLGDAAPVSKAKATTESKNTSGGKIRGENNNEDTLLLQAVSRLHQHNHVDDNFLRPCHQLDYATSGILLVAKTQEAAGHIGRLFEQRHEGVQKSYMAIVVGDLTQGLLCSSNENENDTVNGNPPKVPTWTGGTTAHDLRQQLQRLEEKYRLTRSAAGKHHRRVRDASKNKGKKQSFSGPTFQGFQPAHSIFAKWKSKLKSISTEIVSMESNQAKKEEESISSPSKKRQKKHKFKKQSVSALLTDNDWQQIWDPVNKAVETIKNDSTSEAHFEKLEWKELKTQYPTLKQAMIRAADLHNDILRDTIRNERQKEQHELGKKMDAANTNHCEELPPLFRLSEDSQTTGNGSQKKQFVHNAALTDGTFYICCPLAQCPDQFNMVVPTSVTHAWSNLSTPPGSMTDSNGDANTPDDQIRKLKFRPSLTKCTVMEVGSLSILRNNTKRDIRVTKVRLYPMTGRRHQLRVHMALAGFPILGDVAYGGNRCRNSNLNDAMELDTEIDICSRMCLHAQSLQLPALLGEKEVDWKIETPDPFVFGPNRKLNLT